MAGAGESILRFLRRRGGALRGKRERYGGRTRVEGLLVDGWDARYTRAVSSMFEGRDTYGAGDIMLTSRPLSSMMTGLLGV